MIDLVGKYRGKAPLMFLNERGGGYILRNLEDVERDIYKVQNILRTLHQERSLLLQTLDIMETSSKVLTQMVIEKMKK
jgi:hypothetical protein